MFLIVCLGNPGKQYLKTRHNIGFMAADLISSRLSFSSFSENSKFKGEISSGEAFGNKVILVKPTTYMNLSGESAVAIAHYYKIPLEKIIVIHDDIELKLGDMRVKKGGGHAGHNGLKSLDSHLGKDYWRVRIGVGRPDNKEEVPNYVVENFSKDEMASVHEVFEEILSALKNIILNHH